jgi:hypothetical protein
MCWPYACLCVQITQAANEATVISTRKEGRQVSSHKEKHYRHRDQMEQCLDRLKLSYSSGVHF